MFTNVVLQDTIRVGPNQIGSNIKERIINNLRKNFEKKVIGKINAYIITIADVNEDTIKDGIVNDITGDANYKLEYTATIFKPINGKIIEVTVDYCNDLGIWGHSSLLPSVELIECICPEHLINNKNNNNKETNYEYDEINNEWKSKEGADSIKEGTEIKIKIMNNQIDATKMLIIGELMN